VEALPVAPVELTSVILTALLNPAVIVIAFWLGRNADQRQKLPVAAFAAALAGSVLVYVAVRVGVPGVAGTGRAAAGVFIAQFVFGWAWAAAGFRFGRRP
jgi:zinc transporter ZupT